MNTDRINQNFTPSRWGITAKLFVIHLIVIGVLSGIIVVVFVSFGNIDRQVTTVLDKDVAQVIANAQTGKELVGVFVDLVTTVFYGQEEAGAAILQSLTQKIEALSTQGGNTELQAFLQQFTTQLSGLFEQSTILKTIPTDLTKIENEFIFNIEMLEDILKEKIDDSGNGDPLFLNHFKQIQSTISGYRSAFLQIIMQVNELQRAGIQLQDEKGAAAKEEPAITAIDFLLLRFQTLQSSDAEIMDQGKLLTEIATRYKEQVTRFRATQKLFQEQLAKIRETKEQMLSALKKQDEESAKAVSGIRSSIQGKIWESRNMIVPLFAVIFIVLLFTSYWALKIVRPIKLLAQTARQIAEGNVNIQLARIRSRDEIAELAGEFQTMMTYMQDMSAVAANISEGNLDQEITPRSAQDMLGNAFQRMSIYLKEMATAATAIAEGDLCHDVQPRTEHDVLGKAFSNMKAIRQTMGQIVEDATQIGQAADHLQTISAQMASGAEQTSQQVHVASSNSQHITQNINEVSAAIEELAASSQEIFRTVNEVAHNIGSAVEITTDANHKIAKLETSSREIGDIVKIITTITQQTNVLALNASIEAARAGDVGRGFAVVATEVKDLARAITASAENITRRIKGIQSNTQEATSAITQVSEIIHRVNTLAHSIDAAVKEQSSTANTIAKTMVDVARGSDEITRAITEVASTAQSASAHAASVHEAANGLSRFADQLRELVGKFRI